MSRSERSLRGRRDRQRQRYWRGKPVEDAPEGMEFDPIAGRQSTDTQPGCFIGHRESDGRAVMILWDRGRYETSYGGAPVEGTVVTGLTAVTAKAGSENRTYTVEEGRWREVER